MSLDEVAKECKEAAEYLASQPGEGNASPRTSSACRGIVSMAIR